MAKLLQLLFDWEYAHWMMMTGAVLVAAGFIGLAFHRNRNAPVNESGRARQSTPTERLKAMWDSASASADGQRKRRGNDVAVPELTQNTAIHLNGRVSLRPLSFADYLFERVERTRGRAPISSP
jgi:hypothetical protein